MLFKNDLRSSSKPPDPVKQTLSGLQNNLITKTDSTPKDQNTSKKKQKTLSKRQLSNNLKLPSSYKLPTASRESRSESRPKVSGLKLPSNLSLPQNSKDNISLIDKSIKTPVEKIRSLYTKLNKSFEVIEKSPFVQSPNEYFSLLDDIISRDILFGNYLKKIKEGLKLWFEKYEGIADYCRSLEEKLSEKQSIINQYIISKRHDMTNENVISLEDEYLFKAEEIRKDHIYAFVPNYEWETIQKKIEEDSAKIKELEKRLEDKDLNNRNFECFFKAEAKFAEKEEKINLLIKALLDRGYPIYEIYEKDVLNLSGSLETNQFIFKPELLLSSDSSIRNSLNG